MKEKVTFTLAVIAIFVGGFVSLYHDNDMRLMYSLLLSFSVCILSASHKLDDIKYRNTINIMVILFVAMGGYFLAN